LFFIESFLFNRADLVSTISHGMMKKLKEKTRRETFYFPNWVNGSDINPATSSNHPFLKGDSRCFKILYSGNVGEKQDWVFFNKVVGFFSNRSDVEFIVVGQGAKFSVLREELSGRENIVFHEPVPFSELNDLLCSADLHVLFQKKDVVDTVMPSKILGMMASAVPSLVTGNLRSEVAKVFNDSQAGGFYESGSFDECISFIESLISSADRGRQLGEAARKYILEHFDSKSVLPSFEIKLNQLTL
jgi:colanic acid biosynthesis glycosyl transferase WcaI